MRSPPPLIFGLDTETDHDADCSHAWVVQWSISNGHQSWHGEDLLSLADHIEMLACEHASTDEKHPQKLLFYVHNLDYDISYMLPIIHEWEESGVPVSILMRGRSCISCTIEWGRSVVELRDSLKKWPGAPLKELGRVVGLPKLEPPGGESFRAGWYAALDVDDVERWRYVDRDAEIVAVAMRRLHDGGMDRLTASSDAWLAAHQSVGWPRWSHIFPPIAYPEERRMRCGYHGGLNWSRGPSMIEGPIAHEDRHSMYPTIMSDGPYGRPLPYGQMMILDSIPSDENEELFWIAELRIRIRLKEGATAWWHWLHAVDAVADGVGTSEPTPGGDAWHDVVLTSVDLAALDGEYDWELDPDAPMRVWCWHWRVGVLADYVDRWYAVKKGSKKGSIEYQSAKTMLNSLTGRFGLDAAWDAESHIVERDGMLTIETIETLHDESKPSTSWLPMIMAITSWAQYDLVEHARKCGWETVIHMDTDSVIHSGEPSDTDHSEQMGAWDVESLPVRMWEGGPKRYIEAYHWPPREPSDLHITCSGISRFDAEHPKGPVIELMDSPDLIMSEETELGQEHYHVRSEWLRDWMSSHGHSPDDVDTRRLISRERPGGRILIPGSVKLSQLGMRRRW